MPTDINFNKSLGFVRTSRVAVQSIKFVPVNVTPPAITGNTTLGSVLTLTSVGQWLNYPSSFAYQWKRDGVNITSATNSTYTLVQADSAAFITCVVTATNITGSASTASNQIKADFYSAIPINSGAPVISGSTALSSILTSTTGTWTNSPNSYVFQWKRGATNIGTNNNNYTLVAADSGAAITCVVTASNGSGSSSPATSNTLTAQTYTAPANTLAPVISGTTTLGSTLSSTTGTFTGNPTPTYAYQWRRNAVNITSATGSTYVLVSADSAAAITCVVTATNALGNSSATSNTITADTYATAFTSTWLVTAGETITLPYEVAGTYSGTIDWGDLSTSTNSYANRTHTYAGAGTYTISITGVTTGFRFANTGSKYNIRTITNWGTLRLGNNGNYFQGCANLTLTTVIGTLDLTGINNMSSMFQYCSALTTVNGINSWSTGSIIYMDQMFNGCGAFNQALSFNTAAVQNMQSMFHNAINFNSSLTFNTAAVNNMGFMFYGCSQLNTAPTFSSTANVGVMQSMFRDCINFNKPLTFNTSTCYLMQMMFSGATVFNQDISGWNTGLNTACYAMFQNAAAFNQNISGWNTSACTNMELMFSGATAFNQNLGSWNVANVTTFANFMAGKTPATFSAANLDAIYNGWVTVQSSKIISFGTAQYSAAGTTGRNYLTGTKLWTITDGQQQPTAFTSTWQVTTGETITLPYELSGTYSGTIDWGDSTTSVNSYANRTHTYTTAGTKTISITGTTIGFTFNNTGSKLNIRTITNWGTLRLGNSGNYFFGCTNLTLTTVTGTLDLTGTTNLTLMFGDCSSLLLVSSINSWNTASVTNMTQMFTGCSSISQPLSFNTAAVTNMTQMFFGCTSFNNSIIFNTGLVIAMNNMFQNCTAFNTAPTFSSTASVTSMYAMFYNCTNFNKPLTFNTGAVNNMGYMFGACSAFNGTLTFSSTASVTDMSGMFTGCYNFNQNIGSWNVANVTNFTNFMPSTIYLNGDNLDAIYNGWSVQSVKPNINITFGISQYTAAGAAGKFSLQNVNNWTIVDGGEGV